VRDGEKKSNRGEEDGRRMRKCVNERDR